ncbi:ATP-binding protein [Streptomyces sp. ODS28]|uniref:sensor histidine kinase n=1 Tax=Streptomyces sp. ODS28 TaxID=3136688 RepID=UPI0031E57AA6
MPEPPSHAVQTGRGPSAPASPSGPRAGDSPSPPAVPSVNGSRGRHGRAPTPESPSDTAVRHRLVRLSVLPAGIVAVIAAGVVAYVMASEGALDASGAPSANGDGAVLWSVLAGALLLMCATVVTASMFATSEARGTVERYASLRRAVDRGQTDIRGLVRMLEQGERPRARQHPPLPEPSADADALELLAHELTLSQRAAEAAVTETAALMRSTSSGSDEKVEVFVNLARRLQSLVHREIELLDELENEVEDPDLLKGLFHVDHLATRIRRHAENLAVLGGAVSRRQWSRPVTMTEVLRSAIAEVEQYPRVKLVPPVEGTLRGHAVADVIHLLAELVENATVFSAPQTQVLMRAQYVTAGLAIEVEDRGLGMTAVEQNRMNAVLSDPERIDVGELLQDGRIGLFVVSALARRHGVVVQLQSNIYGGIQAVLVLPSGLLGDEPEDGEGARRPHPQQSAHPQETGRVPEAAVQEAVAGGGHLARAHPEQNGGGAGGGSAGSGPAGGGQRPAPAPAPPGHGAAPGQGPVPAPVPAQAQSSISAHRSAVPQQAPQQAQPVQHGNGQEGTRTFVRADSEPPAVDGPEGHEADPGHLPGPGDGVPNSERPRLPKRRRQEHLVPELRDPPRRDWSGAGRDDEEAGHDPGLMAAFRRGTSLAEEAEGNEGRGAGPQSGARQDQ